MVVQQLLVPNKWLLVVVEVDWAKAGVDGKLKDGVLETPKLAGLLDVEFDWPTAGIDGKLKDGVLEEPQANEGLAVKPKGGVRTCTTKVSGACSTKSLGAGYGDADSSAKSRLTW